MTCAMCRERGKTWDGGDPRCAFPDGGAFTPDNWNCATANALREFINEWGMRPEQIDGVSLGVADDQKHATFALGRSDCEDPLALWMTWYKRGGETASMWLLFEEGAPRRPAEADALAVIAACKSRAASAKRGTRRARG